MALEQRWLWGLQVVGEPLDLIDEEVDVRLGDRRIGDDHSEEVYFIALRLVAHHGGPRLHHHGLDLWRHLLEWKRRQNRALYSWKRSNNGNFFYWLFEANRGGTYSVIIVVPCGVFLASHLRLACLSGWVECTRSKRWCAAAAGRNEHVRYRSRWVFIYLFAFTYNNILLNTAVN